MAKKLKPSPEYSTFFNTLIEICDKRNDVSVTNLVDKFSSSKSAMTAWKKGTIKADIIPKLALELDVSIDYLLTGKEKVQSVELTQDGKRLLGMYNSLNDMEKGEMLGRLTEITKNRH